jgi:hypothetical protein
MLHTFGPAAGLVEDACAPASGPATAPDERSGIAGSGRFTGLSC